jgi:hypothetical protein
MSSSVQEARPSMSQGNALLVHILISEVNVGSPNPMAGNGDLI